MNGHFRVYESDDCWDLKTSVLPRVCNIPIMAIFLKALKKEESGWKCIAVGVPYCEWAFDRKATPIFEWTFIVPFV